MKQVEKNKLSSNLSSRRKKYFLYCMKLLKSCANIGRPERYYVNVLLDLDRIVLHTTWNSGKWGPQDLVTSASDLLHPGLSWKKAGLIFSQQNRFQIKCLPGSRGLKYCFSMIWWLKTPLRIMNTEFSNMKFRLKIAAAFTQAFIWN